MVHLQDTFKTRFAGHSASRKQLLFFLEDNVWSAEAHGAFLSVGVGGVVDVKGFSVANALAVQDKCAGGASFLPTVVWIGSHVDGAGFSAVFYTYTHLLCGIVGICGGPIAQNVFFGHGFNRVGVVVVVGRRTALTILAAEGASEA